MAAGAGTGVPVRRGPSLFLCCRGEVGDYERSARRARRLQRRDQGGRPAVPSPWCRGSNSPSPDTRGARCEPVSPRRVRTTTTMRPASCAPSNPAFHPEYVLNLKSRCSGHGIRSHGTIPGPSRDSPGSGRNTVPRATACIAVAGRRASPRAGDTARRDAPRRRCRPWRARRGAPRCALARRRRQPAGGPPRGPGARMCGATSCMKTRSYVSPSSQAGGTASRRSGASKPAM